MSLWPTATCSRSNRRGGSQNRSRQRSGVSRSASISESATPSTQALRELIATYGGVDILINTAALFPSSADGKITDEQWTQTLDINVTANYLIADEAAKILREQNLDASIVLTSSANAVVPKRGSEAYDLSKAAVSHLVRELAVSLAPKVRVNGISPATVIKGSTMFPRDRVISSLKKYDIPFQEAMSDDELRTAAGKFLRQAHTDPSGNRSQRLRGSHPLPGRPEITLYHGTFDPRRRRTHRGILAMTNASHDFDGRLERESGNRYPALVAIDLGADSCRVSLLRWIDGKPEIQLVHRFANGPIKEAKHAALGHSSHLQWRRRRTACVC